MGWLKLCLIGLLVILLTRGDPVKKKKVVVAKTKIPVLIFLKLLSVKKKILLAKPIAIGVLIMCSGAGFTMARMAASKYSFDTFIELFGKFHKGHANGHGWSNDWLTKFYDYHRRPPPVRKWRYPGAPQHYVANLRNPYGYTKSVRLEKWAPGNGHRYPDRSVKYDDWINSFSEIEERIVPIFSDSLGPSDSESEFSRYSDKEYEVPRRTEFSRVSANETEEYLEHYLHEHMASAQNEGSEGVSDLIKDLREAFSQTLPDFIAQNGSIQIFGPSALSIHQDIKHFGSHLVPMSAEDEYLVTSDSRMGETKVGKPLSELVQEIRKIFVLLSAFDKNSCLKKLVCDIHTKVNESPKKLDSYESSVISMFTLMKSTFAKYLLDRITPKYVAAASFGETNLSPKECHRKYPECEYTAKQLIKMGKDLERPSLLSRL